MSRIKAPTIGSALRGGIITLEIGQERVKYCVHKALLVHYSEYFRKALNGPWKEADEGVVVLGDVQPAAVNLFVQWLYVQDLSADLEIRTWCDIVGPGCQDAVVGMFQAYAFADRFLVPTFRRAINGTIIDYFVERGDMWDVEHIPETAIEAFSIIPADRPILQLLIDVYCTWWDGCCENPRVDFTKAPPAFLARLVRRFGEIKMEGSIEDQGGDMPKDRCYAEHADDKETLACGKQHMRYDKIRKTGIFGEGIICQDCGVIAPLEDENH